MEIFGAVLSSAYQILSYDMTLLGFTFSYWDVIIWSLAATIVGVLIVKFLFN